MSGQRFFSINSEDKQSALEDAWDAAPDGDGTLRGQLRIFEKSAKQVIQGGGVVQSSSSNSHSSSDFAPGAGAPAAIEYARVWRELINLFDSSKAWLQNPPLNLVPAPIPIPNPTDEDIYAKMNDWLIPITERQSDYSNLKLTGVQYI